MRIRNAHRVVTTLLFTIILLCPLFGNAQAPVPLSSHVVLVIDENTSYVTTLSQMPWLVGQGTANGHTSIFTSNTPGSAMDYFWLASGSCHSSVNCTLPVGTHDFTCDGNGCTLPITDDNIFREMNNRGISWKVYAQSYAEAGAQIYQIQVWDKGTGQKLAEAAPGTSIFKQVLTLSPGTHQLVVEDISTGNFQVLHKAVVSLTAVADGVNIASPLPGALSGPVVRVNASATESSAQIYQLQIWDSTTGQKLGESAPGTSTINQTFSLAPGVHQIAVEDISIGTFQTLHKSVVNITVQADGVSIVSPLSNSTAGPQILVSASARESAASIYQLQVWDATTGLKLGESAPGTSTNQTFLLTPGTHQIIVEDIAGGTFQTLHKSSVTVNVP